MNLAKLLFYRLKTYRLLCYCLNSYLFLTYVLICLYHWLQVSWLQVHPHNLFIFAGLCAVTYTVGERSQGKTTSELVMLCEWGEPPCLAVTVCGGSLA